MFSPVKQPNYNFGQIKKQSVHKPRWTIYKRHFSVGGGWKKKKEVWKRKSGVLQPTNEYQLCHIQWTEWTSRCGFRSFPSHMWPTHPLSVAGCHVSQIQLGMTQVMHSWTKTAADKQPPSQQEAFLQVSSILKAVVHKVEDAALGLFPSRLKKKETNGKSRRVHDSNSHYMSYFGGKKTDWDSMWKFESINSMHE